MPSANQLIHNYPEPKFPISPVLSRYSCKLHKQEASQESILNTKSHVHVSSGRAAIALALEHANIGKDDEVLIPAYHCESMVSPIRWRKSAPIFYKINSDTTINEEDIESKVTSKTKAIIATHYFGFIQDLSNLRKFCDRHELLLIEDCAHAFFGIKNGSNVGSIGDYAIASSMKFFPVYDGGLLASNHISLRSFRLHKPPLTFTLKATLNVIEHAIESRRLGTPGRLAKGLLAIKSILWGGLKKLTNKSETTITGPGSSEGGHDLDEHWIHKTASYSSKYLIEHANFSRIVESRRQNFTRLHESIAHLSGITPLYKSLPENVVPLVYPIFVEEPEKHFAPLKKLGVPIWRFGEFLDDAITNAVCENSVKFSAHIFQLPCHQELKQEELDWLIEKISNEFSN